MIPRTLGEWTLERLTEMLDKNMFEAESFDYKEFRRTKKSEQEKQDIRKDCCAFANSLGGFLIFGVTNDNTAPTKDRLVGIDKSFDFPAAFGNFPQECKPSIRWDVLNPPIDLGNGKVVHVIHIPQSWRGPHSISADKPLDGFVFTKRTNKGNEAMSYEEVRMAFLGYYEKRIKLRLLQAELANIISVANTIMSIAKADNESSVPTTTFNLDVIEAVLVETYTITHDKMDLHQALMSLRHLARTVNIRMQNFTQVIYTPMPNKEAMARTHNQTLRSECPKVIAHAKQASDLLQQFLGPKESD